MMLAGSLQVLIQVLDELHSCARVSVVVTSRVKPTPGWPVLELSCLDTDNATKLLLRHSGAQAVALQHEPWHLAQLAKLCNCNALLLRIMGSTLAAKRCSIAVRSYHDTMMRHAYQTC